VLAVGASTLIALSGTAGRGSAGAAAGPAAAADGEAGVAAVTVPSTVPSGPSAARELPSDGPSVALRAPQPGALDGAASGQAEGRPTVVLPEVAPVVALRAARGSRVVILGDSYASGWNGAGLGSRNWTSIVGRSRGWTVTNLAVAGTGYQNPGWTNQPVGSLVSRTIRLRPDVVILAAGHNDSRWSAASTSREADRVIARLRAGLPDAVLVIVAPIWQNGSPPTRCLVLRDHLRRTAAGPGALFVDPLAERWFAGADHRFIGPDGVHPTNAGHRHIADEVLADLAATLST
jgi:lysophospholipase L1-like esterase